MKKTDFPKLITQGCGFATLPEIWIRKTPQKKGTTIQHLIFGDFISPPKGDNGYQKWSEPDNSSEVDNDLWIRVRSREEEGWILIDEIQLERILEINFVDVGQGDGCHVVTPSDEHLLIDAGVSDNMFRFLKWRFNLEKPGVAPPAFTAIISHPDKDHFYGFKNLFDPPETLQRRIAFKHIYHNGLIQRAESNIGEELEDENREYRVAIETDAEANAILEDEKPSQYQQILKSAKESFPQIKISMLYRKNVAQPNFFPIGAGDGENKLKIEVLGPLPEKVDGKLALRWLEDTGKTKNGHSILLKLTIGKVAVFLGGDLNSQAADFIMEKYSGQPMAELRKKLKSKKENEVAEGKQKMKEAVETCRKTFQCHVAKSCHHGSQHITNEFLDSVNPIATVISSGDEESYCHPRPETLGAIGKFSRGERPLLYSTELSRSSPEYIKLRKQDYPTETIKEKIVVNYGMINVRTDGELIVLAQKLEKGRSSFGKITKWQIEKLVWNEKVKDFVYED